jgi:hypoxanthine phosphoribosyltransferase/DNA-directed RNA polymerase subunit RPC12/RpoP
MPSKKQGFEGLQKLAGTNLCTSFEGYQGQHSLVKFRCSECKEEFITTPFLYSKNSDKNSDAKRCLRCKKKLRVKGKEGREEFIRRCREKNGDYYDYSLLPAVFRMGKCSKIKIICPEHGIVEVLAHEHMKQGMGCGHCKGARISETKRKPRQQFIDEANQKHQFKYNYELVKYKNAHEKVQIICPVHGIFEQSPDCHLRGCGCSICHSTSQAVKDIMNLLDRHEVVYETEKIFPECCVQRPLRFDLYLPEHNLCIEYDGIQHTQPVKFGSQTIEEARKAYQETIERDRVKEEYCEKNNVGLIRIPHIIKNPDSFLMSLIKNYRKSRYIYTWEDYGRDLRKLANSIRSFGYEELCVYGISRGGLVPAAHISNILECSMGVVKYQRYDADDHKVELQVKPKIRSNTPIFVVDDLISSGLTMKKVVSFLQFRFKSAPIHPVVLFGLPNEDGIIYINEHPKKWIIFPWESK